LLVNTTGKVTISAWLISKIKLETMAKTAKRHNTPICSFSPPAHTLPNASSLDVLGRGKR